MLDSSLDEKNDFNDFTINSLDVDCVNNMQNPKLGDATLVQNRAIAPVCKAL